MTFLQVECGVAEGNYSFDNSRGKKGCAVEWALKGWEIIELAMGNESSLYQSRSRSSVDL